MNEYEKAKDEVEFDKKYGALYRQFMQKDSEYKELIKNGAGRFLNTPEIRKQIADKAVDNYADVDASLMNLLTNEISFLNIMIDAMYEGLGTSYDEQFEKEKEKATNSAKAIIDQAEKEVQKKIEANYYVQMYDYYVMRYKELVEQNSKGDYEGILEKAHKDNQTQIDKVINDSSAEEISRTKARLEKQAENLAYQYIKKQIDDRKKVKKAVQSFVKKQCQKLVNEEYDDSLRLGKLDALALQEKICRNISRIPQDIMDFIDGLVAKFYKLICGIDADIPNLQMKDKLGVPDIEALKAKIKTILNQVLGGFDKLNIPMPPMLKPILDMMQDSNDGIQLTAEQLEELQRLKKSYKIPSAWKNTLQTLVQTVYTVILMMPTLLIKLIFDMIDAIVSAIKQLGGPTPYPLSLVPDAIELIPKVYELQQNFPQIMQQIVEDKLKDLGAKMHMFGVGLASNISQIEMPEVPSPSLECPEALKAQLELKKLKENEKKLQEQKEKVDELQKKIDKETDTGLKDTYKKLLAGMKNDLNSMFGSDSYMKYGSHKEAEVSGKLRKLIENQARKYMPMKQLADPTKTVEDMSPEAEAARKAEEEAAAGRASYGR